MTASITGYWLGRTPTIACQADQRFSYCLYVPANYAARTAPTILVALHDTLRNHHALRDAFAGYAERANCIVLAPLFPAGIGEADDLDHYKYLRFGDIHFDELLLAMAREVAARYGVDGERFALFGFSGGAHFAHRFLYAHPERLLSLVVGAPGSVTLPIEDHAWWPGLKDFAAVFGRDVQWERIRAVPTYLVVGADDVDPRGIVNSADHPNWVEGANAAGANRVERLRTLHAHLSKRQDHVTFEALAGVRHEIDPIVKAAIGFFDACRAPNAAS
jgi:pimeloyl-ACP methyl ester carboxylesterase